MGEGWESPAAQAPFSPTFPTHDFLSPSFIAKHSRLIIHDCSYFRVSPTFPPSPLRTPLPVPSPFLQGFQPPPPPHSLRRFPYLTETFVCISFLRNTEWGWFRKSWSQDANNEKGRKWFNFFFFRLVSGGLHCHWRVISVKLRFSLFLFCSTLHLSHESKTFRHPDNLYSFLQEVQHPSSA